MGLVLLEADDQALDLLGQLVGICFRSPVNYFGDALTSDSGGDCAIRDLAGNANDASICVTGRLILPVKLRLRDHTTRPKLGGDQVLRKVGFYYRPEVVVFSWGAKAHKSDATDLALCASGA